LNNESSDLGRLRWHCRRGMRELDVLLLSYLENEYPQATAEDRRAFVAILDLPDPQILGYLLDRAQPQDATIAHVIHCIAAYRH
jgi:antitoxin CptB